MSEDEYYIIKQHLNKLDFRIPQSGIKFKYGIFTVESLIDQYGKEVYAIRRYEFFSLLNNSAHLYPQRNDIGFSIRDLDMPFQIFMQFIAEIEKQKDKIESGCKRVLVRENFIINLLRSAKEKCPICIEEYNSELEISLFLCGYHSAHRSCAETYGLQKKCPVCRL